MKREFDTFGLDLRMRSMLYSSKDFESLSCFGKRTEETIRCLYQASLTVGCHDGAEVSFITTRFSRRVRCVACQRLNFLRKSSRQLCWEEPTTIICCQWPLALNKNNFLIGFRRVRWSKLPQKVLFKPGRHNWQLTRYVISLDSIYICSRLCFLWF